MDVRHQPAVRIGIVLNGESAKTEARTLADLVAALGHGEAQVATAVNGEFVPRSARGSTRLTEGDAVEIVAPRQGG
jgi:sulfur carrier protein